MLLRMQLAYAMHRSCSHHAVIHVYDAAGNVIETHDHAGHLAQVLFAKGGAAQVQKHKYVG
jgi:hypothetical protein